MSKKENIKNQNIYPFNGPIFPKKDMYKLFIFDKFTNENIGLVEGLNKADCFNKAKCLFDENEFLFSSNENSKYQIKIFHKPKLLFIYHDQSREHCNTILGNSKKECWKLAGELLNDDVFDVTFNPIFGKINGLKRSNTNCYLYT